MLVCTAGPYEARSMKVLKKNGYFQHIMNQGWLPTVGKYADTPVEALFILKGYDTALENHEICTACTQIIMGYLCEQS